MVEASLERPLHLGLLFARTTGAASTARISRSKAEAAAKHASMVKWLGRPSWWSLSSDATESGGASGASPSCQSHRSRCL